MQRFTQVLEATMKLLRAFQPFVAEIQAVEIAPNFREPVIGKYNGTRDLQSHVNVFQTQMFTHGGNDTSNCKMFAGTLVEVALKWFKDLPARSAIGFEDLAHIFVQHFSAKKKNEAWLGELFDISQGSNETLKSFLDQFSKAIVLVKIGTKNSLWLLYERVEK